MSTPEVMRLIARDAEAAAYKRANGIPLTEERRSRARDWAREQLTAAAERAETSREARDEVRRRIGWHA